MSTIGERPGVYASYEVSGVSYSGISAGTVGVAAIASSGASGDLYEINSFAEAVSAFGSDANITELIRILIKNGVRTIRAVPLIPPSGQTYPLDSDYCGAFEALVADEDVKVIICDSKDAEVIASLKSVITEADDRNGHKIGIAEGCGIIAADEATALSLNSERIVLVTPPALNSEGENAVTGSLAAAVAGAVIAGPDPAVPLNGAALYGLGGLSQIYTDANITTIVQGGVTPVECVGGTVSVIRGITTRTKTNGVSDATYRELTTTLIIDDVVPTIRNALAASFSRTKNTSQTRGAIRTRVILELEKKAAAEIIDGYDNVKVAVNAEAPTICDVSFEFTVAHGLNQIRLTAYITV